jgi:putative ABC transport system permease protein
MILRLVRRYLMARRIRVLLTLLGVASAMVLFIGVASLSDGLTRALSGSDAARTLIVYRKNRYCPQTSFLPERYEREIASVPGVVSVLPVKVFLNNCRASLDLVAFQGVPADRVFAARRLELDDEARARFLAEPDAALLGRAFADRRGLGTGDKFQFGGIQVKVGGVFRSQEPVEEGVILTHLEFLQRQGPVNRLGTVTQFEVKIADPARAKEIAQEIDRRLATAEEPTDTRPKLLYLESATRDLRDVLRFARGFGAACAALILVLVANTMAMAALERRRHHGVLLAIGYRGRHLVALVAGETLLLAVLGSALGIAIALIAIRTSGVAFGVEGVSVAFSTSPGLVLRGLALALGIGLLAGLPSAVRAARTDPVASLRSE